MESSFKESVKKGFTSCKNDISKLEQFNNKLIDEINVLKNNLTKKENEFDLMKSKISNLEKNYLDVMSEVKSLNKVIDLMKELIKSNNEKTELKKDKQNDLIMEEVKKEAKKELKKKEPEDTYEALLAYKAKQNKKTILKNKILSLISENGISLSELKFLIVNHFKYVSNATFYNYIKELEFEKRVIIKRDKDKNYIFLLNEMEQDNSYL